MFTAPNGDRPDVQNMAIIITNGNSNINKIDALPEAIRAKVKVKMFEEMHIYKCINHTKISNT